MDPARGAQVAEMSDSSLKLDRPVREVQGHETEDTSLRVGRLPSPSREGSIKSLFSNLRDFLVERPTKIKAGTPTAFDIPKFGTGLGDNFKEFLHSGPKGNVRSALLVDWHEEPSLWRNLRDLISPRKLPPLKTTSQPIPVPEIWSKNEQFGWMQLTSIIVHGLAIAFIVLLPFLFPNWLTPPVTKASSPDVPTDVTVSPFLTKLQPAAKKAGGGGGQADNAPAAKGKPPKFSWTQISRPMVNPPKSAITVNPTVLGNPDIKLPDNNAQNWGDPFSHTLNGSMGNGHGNGLGDGNGNGVGPGQGYGTGGGVPRGGVGGDGTPASLYCPRADYSDEAMKVKVQGVVELIAIITADGRVTDVHVAKGLGLGLDEKAIEAVRTWRLKPALGPDGKPATVRQIIEVTFQLY
jgi:periplasmic protein TonB